jgi:uncharacterized surface protein with fasciclin (FAS1) repeats
MMLRHSLMLGLACAALAACGGDNANTSAGNAAAGNTAGAAAEARGTIGDALAGSADHSSLVQALRSSGLIDTLGGAGPYTVFAPTNAAFEAIPEDARRSLMAPEQRERLTELLSYHIVSGTVTAEDLGRAIDRGQGGRAELATVTGENLGVSRDGNAIVVSDAAGGRARVTRADQNSSNGVVHSIDAVLMPGS